MAGPGRDWQDCRVTDFPGGAANGPIRSWAAAPAAEESCWIIASSGFFPVRLVDGENIEAFTPTMERRFAW